MAANEIVLDDTYLRTTKSVHHSCTNQQHAGHAIQGAGYSLHRLHSGVDFSIITLIWLMIE
jgi:hypothetical protein